MSEQAGSGTPARFVVLALPRSGSNWLCSMLDAHPEILCHHEIFNPKEVKYAVSWRRRGRSLGDRDAREADPLGFLQDLWAAPVAERIVGFKINRGQDARIFDAVLSDPTIRKILMVRGNRVRAFVSECIALATNQWESYPWSRFERNKLRVTVEPEALRTHIATNAAYVEDLRARVAGGGQPLLELHYERIGEVAEQNRALAHLGAAPVRESLAGVTERLNPAPLSELVANFDELRAALQGTELEPDLQA